MANYKTVNEILNMVNRTTYPRIARQLPMLALTQFAREIEEQGGKIISCHPEQIKTNDNKVVRVVGSYLHYTYDENTYFYFQFEENPFFTPKGFRKNINKKIQYTTGIIELNHMYDNINEYSIEDKYIKQLVKNLHESEKYLQTTKMIYSKRIYNNKTQEIYTN